MTRAVLVGLVFLFSVTTARALPLTLLDTQPDPSAPCGVVCDADVIGDWDGEWLGAEFSLGGSYTLTLVEGWIQTFTAGDMMVAIYSDGGSVPGAQLFSAQTSLPSSTNLPFYNEPDWYGVSGVSWTLGPGDYWVVFGVPFPTLPSAALTATSATPVAGAAWAYSGHGLEQDWNPFPYQPYWGIRIQGTPAVPEPSALAFLATAALAFASRSQSGRRLMSTMTRLGSYRRQR